MFAGSILAFLDDVYAVCGEPLRRRKDTDLEQRWRTFDTSQLADQRRASWRPKRTGVTVKRGFASRAKWNLCLRHGNAQTGRVLLVSPRSSGTSAEKDKHSGVAMSWILRVDMAAFQYWGLGLQSVCRFREAAHQSSLAECPATGMSRNTSVAARIGMELAGNIGRRCLQDLQGCTVSLSEIGQTALSSFCEWQLGRLIADKFPLKQSSTSPTKCCDDGAGASILAVSK